jgi:thioredoxin-related protein
LKRWVAEKGATFPVGMNNTPTNWVKKFSVRAYPTNVIFDREGKVVSRAEGFDPDQTMADLKKAGLQIEN